MTTATTATTAKRVGQRQHDEAPPEPEKPALEVVKTTLGDQGDKLPIGILDADGRLHKDIVCKPWKTKDERALGEKVAPDSGMVDYVPLVVANMCTRIGPHNMADIDDARRSVILSTMYMADVFYAYALLRNKAMGHKLPMTIACGRPQCGVKFAYAGDLRTIEVRAITDIDQILQRYDLENPITLRKQTVTHVTLSYPKWSVMEQARGVTNEADIKAYVIQGSIIGLNDNQKEPVALTLAEVDELSKRDFEGIQAAINENFLGPKMGVEGACTPEVCTRFKRGGHEFKMAIDWSYRNFFAASFRSPV